MMHRYLVLLTFSTIFGVCNNAPAPDQSAKAAANSFVDTFKDDTIPAYEDLPVASSSLDEETQMRIFKTVLKDVKPKKLFDFSSLDNGHLPGAYRNFSKTLNSYRDSADERYTEFFMQFFEKLELHEEEISAADTLDVRTRLEIARIKSEINAGLAEKKSGPIAR